MNSLLTEMQAVAEEVAGLMKSLSNKHRLMTLCQLVDGEMPVGRLARALRLRDPAMSQQLAVLRRDGLVKSRRDGQTVYYSLAREDVKRLIQFLYDNYCGKP